MIFRSAYADIFITTDIQPINDTVSLFENGLKLRARIVSIFRFFIPFVPSRTVRATFGPAHASLIGGIRQG